MNDRIATIGVCLVLFVLIFIARRHDKRLDRLEKQLFITKAQIDDHVTNDHGTNAVIMHEGIQYRVWFGSDGRIKAQGNYTITNDLKTIQIDIIP